MGNKNNKRPPAPKPDTEADVELENNRREMFCRLYAQGDETFGNATLSYAAAYDHTSSSSNSYHACSVGGSRLLTVDEVKARITVLLNELLKDEIVDAELVKIIKQDGDLGPKVQAIKEYNKLRGRIVDKSLVTQVQKLDMDDIRALISVLPQERQDYFYAIISDILAEADQLRGSGGKAQGDPSQRSKDDTKEVPE